MSGLRGVVLTVRFLCELAMLVALAYWGLTAFDGALSYVAGVGAPLVAILIWAQFVAPKARNPVSPPVRLAIENGLFVATTLALSAVDRLDLGLVFLAAALTSSSLNAWTETTEHPS